MASLRALLLPLLLVPVSATPSGGAQCTTTSDANTVRRSIKQSVYCNNQALRNGPGVACAEVAPPPCAGRLVDDATALAYGANDPAPAAADTDAVSAQLYCQRGIGQATARYVDRKLSLLVEGRSEAEAAALAVAWPGTRPAWCCRRSDPSAPPPSGRPEVWWTRGGWLAACTPFSTSGWTGWGRIRFRSVPTSS